MDEMIIAGIQSAPAAEAEETSASAIFIYTPATRKILQEVARERFNQDQEWGGPKRDDQHTQVSWVNLIEYQSEAAWGATGGDGRLADPVAYRARLVKVAALAVAALESFDRKQTVRDGS